MANKEGKATGTHGDDSLLEKAGELLILLGKRAKRELKEGIQEGREKLRSLMDEMVTKLEEDERSQEQTGNKKQDGGNPDGA